MVYFFAQRKRRLTWENIAESENFSVVEKTLQEHSIKYKNTQIRIVRSVYEANSKKWSHQLALFVDLNHTDYLFFRSGFAKNREHIEKLSETCVSKEPLSQSNLVGSKQIEEKPYTEANSRKVFRVPKSFIRTFSLFLLSFISLMIILNYRFPTEFQQISPLTFFQQTKSIGKKNNSSEQLEELSPLTVGATKRTIGVAEPLIGRWSATECSESFIEFTPFDFFIYSRNTMLKPIFKHSIAETIEDEFQFFLRVEENKIEHYTKLTRNNIKYSGTSTRLGFREAERKLHVYRRCR
tara:strand:- start:2806 stop:3690 length:885 start_codon:yes stop_codon:yes gene_type:complete